MDDFINFKLDLIFKAENFKCCSKYHQLLFDNIQKFLIQLNKHLLDGPYMKSQIYNMDEISIPYDCFRNSTLKIKRVNIVSDIKNI